MIKDKDDKEKIIETLIAVEHLGNSHLNEMLYKQLEELEAKKSPTKDKKD